MSGFKSLKFVSDDILYVTLVQGDCFGYECVDTTEDKSDDAKDRYYKVL